MVLDTIGGFYFVVNEGSGILTVRNSLLSDDAQNYVVSISLLKREVNDSLAV